MKRLLTMTFCLVGSVAACWVAGADVASAAGAPTITSLSASSLTRSGRVLVSGTGFGPSQGTSTLVIGGLAAPVTRWSDTLVVGYVPEATPVGAAGVQVVVGGTASNVVPLTVTLRQANGRVKWRFQADAQVGYLLQRPAVGRDGTVVAHDPAGNVYALGPDGGLKWIFRTPQFAAGPPSIGPDGTVYVAASSTIYALAGADGTVKWTFTEPPGGQGVIAGPTVGPDGNIYATTDLGGLGAIALSPAGRLLWSNPGSPDHFAEYGEIGAEIAFGPSAAGGAVDQLYLGFDQVPFTRPQVFGLSLGGTERWVVNHGGTDNGGMQGQRQPTVGPDGTVYMTSWSMFDEPCSGSCLYAFDPASGKVKWYYGPFPANGMSAPSVAADGMVYVGRSLAYLDAVTPAGTTKWSVFDGGVLAHPTVDPQDRQVLSGEAPNYGQPGVVKDFSAADGHLLWQFGLPSENGGYQVLYSRPRFAPDGNTAYFGTFISAPGSPDQYTYLYAVDTGSAPSGVSLSSLALNPTQVTGGTASAGTVTLTGPAPTGGAVVPLTSSNTALASVPASVTVPGGATSATFHVTTSGVSVTSTATIGGSYGGQSRNAVLTVVPAAASLSSLTLDPSRVRGGSSSTGMVTLTGPAPAGGAVVTLRSSAPSVASAPSTVTVPAGAASARFTVRTSRVTSTRTVSISASYAGGTKSALLTVMR